MSTSPAAVACVDELREAWRAQARGSMRIGWMAWQMKRDDLWAAAGFAGEAECRDSIGISQRVWGRMVRLAETFTHLDREDFLGMTADNADLLAKLPEAERYDPDLLEMARTLTAAKFERALLERRAEAENVPLEEVRVKLKLNCFEGQKKVILEGLEDFRMEHGLEDLATAAEWIVMENTGRQTIMAFLREAVPRLRRASNAKSEEDLRQALNEHVLGLARVIEAIRGKSRRAA